MGRKFSVSAELRARDVGASRTVRNFRNEFGLLQNTIRGLIGGGVLVAARVAFEELQEAITLGRQRAALSEDLAAAGQDLDQFLAKMREVSDGTISASNIIQSSSRALLLGIPAEELSSLLEIARASAVATGQSVSQAFEDITTGIGRASPLILDNLGFVISLEESYGKLAERLGKTTSDLTKAEQSQALLNEVLDQGKERVEAYGDALEGGAGSLGSRIDRLRSRLSDARLELVQFAESLERGIQALEDRADSGPSEFTIRIRESLAAVEELRRSILRGVGLSGLIDQGVLEDIRGAAAATSDLATKRRELTAAETEAVRIGQQIAAVTGNQAEAQRIAAQVTASLIAQERELEALRAGSLDTLKKLGIETRSNLLESLAEVENQRRQVIELERQGELTRSQLTEATAQLRQEEEALRAVLEGEASSVESYNESIASAVESTQRLGTTAQETAETVRGAFSSIAEDVRTELEATARFSSETFDEIARSAGRAAATVAAALAARRRFGGGGLAARRRFGEAAARPSSPWAWAPQRAAGPQLRRASASRCSRP